LDKIKIHIRIILLTGGLLVSVSSLIIYQNNIRDQSQLLINIYGVSELRAYTSAYHRILQPFELFPSGTRSDFFVNNTNITVFLSPNDSSSMPEICISDPECSNSNGERLVLSRHNTDGKYIVASSSKTMLRSNAKSVIVFFIVLFFILIVADLIYNVIQAGDR